MIESVQWEYTTVTAAGSLNVAGFLLELNAHGSLGWEVVSIASVDPTIGINRLTAILKREVLGWPPPQLIAPQWHLDPTGRHSKRYWDGLRWTQHVTNVAGATDTDYPNRR